MKLSKDYLWPAIGIAAVGLSAWLLFEQLKDISFVAVLESFQAIPYYNWVFAALSAVSAFVALAGYDRLALRHLRVHINFFFVAATSFTTYALAHNIGASVVSGAMVRYRAYSAKGLNAVQIGVLVAFCSFTFALAGVFLGGVVLLLQPDLLQKHFLPDFPDWGSKALAASLLGFVALYLAGSALRLPPLRFRHKRLRRFRLEYPRLRIVVQQLLVGPLEILAAAGIIYFALPEASNPGYLVVLGVFLASFMAALLSHAPGGLGVFEVMFFLALPNFNEADLLAALLIFRLFYFLIPLAISIVLVVLFERAQLLTKLSQAASKISARKR